MENKILSSSFNGINRFKNILRELDDKYNYQVDLDDAISIWCERLSINSSEEVKQYANQWLKNDYIVDLSLRIYRRILIITDNSLTRGSGNAVFSFKNFPKLKFIKNIKEAKDKMSNKSILAIAFVLTGIGLLLFLLNKKEDSNNSRCNNLLNNAIAYQPRIKEKYILALLIKSDRYQELIHSLKDKDYLPPEDSSKLYGATQGLWIGSKNKFDNSQIKRELINCKPVTSTSEYDVHFITIELDGDDSRFYPGVNPMDRRDAFMELGKRSPRITVSSRLPCKAYENTEFYSR